ncbi:MAG: DUF4349 domain-containing protein [Gemmatimonadaceae bacterium]
MLNRLVQAVPILFLVGCGNGRPSREVVEGLILRREAKQEFLPVSLSSEPAAAPAVAAAPAGGSIPRLASGFAVQQLIRTADLQVQVDSVPRAVRLADSIVIGLGGMSGDAHQFVGLRDARTAQFTLRVPSGRLSDALAAIRKLGDVKEESMNVQDISREYADLETRLAVKEQTLERLRALLGNRTAKLSDVLDVERELARTVTELEQMKGEKRFDDQQVAMSVVTVRLFDHHAGRGPTIASSLTAAIDQAVDVFESSVGMLVYFVTFLIPWLALITLFWILGWRVHRARQRSFQTVAS